MKDRLYVVGFKGERQVIYGNHKKIDPELRWVERMTIRQARIAIKRMGAKAEIYKLVPVKANTK